ncbi:RNA chaperone Hfq [Peribacillus sp. NPDC097225]|uniref:RNA chaperone Hfq n=1 Tax=Peribacillus sp. NPDC097225 TaxID=3364400 RepID=UPI0037F3BB8E
MTEQTKRSSKQSVAPTREKPYKFRKGQEVKVAFLDGKSITGKIHQFSRYHIVLELQGKEELITVFKHAIKYIVSKKPEDISTI